ncbi:hypothetical protein L9F63_023429, partial [Diploptera punctata]
DGADIDIQGMNRLKIRRSAVRWRGVMKYEPEQKWYSHLSLPLLIFFQTVFQSTKRGSKRQLFKMTEQQSLEKELK